MRYLVLMGSPRRHGNTAALLQPFMDELHRGGNEVRSIALHRKNIQGCIECFKCQQVLDGPGCSLHDDMEQLYPEVLATDVIVWAAPIFTWFCPPEMKALMDRLFCLSKKYNDLEDKPLLLAGKRVALITTYGDVPATGPDLFETGLRRECSYAGMEFVGHLGVRDIHGLEDFTCDAAVAAARAFAVSLSENTCGSHFIP